MIVLATLVLIRDGPTPSPRPMANPAGLSNFIGICVYSFMCHHSLPALVTPFSDKRRVGRFLAADYALILCFYSLLALTGVFAFASVPDLYTLNFQPNRCDPSKSVTDVKFIQYFLALFPVFTLSTNFPIISITLRENLRNLLVKKSVPSASVGLNGVTRRRTKAFIDRVVFPLITLVPPVMVSLIVSDLEFLVGVTGSYAGVGIQYVIPAALVWRSRAATADHGRFPARRDGDDKYTVFGNKFWIFLVLLWALACLVFVTINHITTRA
jgi:amino acid permease